MSLKNYAAFLIILLILAVSFSGCINCLPTGQGPTVLPTVLATPVPTITVLPPTVMPIKSLDTGTQLVWSLTGGDGQLAVNNTLKGEDAILILASLSDPKTPLAAIYVKGGDDYTVYGIGDGQYVLYDMIGNDWNDSKRSFTHTTEYARFNKTLSYYSTATESKVYWVTLSRVGQGDTQSQSVNIADMPAI
jgi:hypothetical protein